MKKSKRTWKIQPQIVPGAFVRAKWSDHGFGLTQGNLYVILWRNQGDGSMVEVVNDYGHCLPVHIRRFRFAPNPV